MSFRSRNTAIAAISNTMFFPNVCQFVNTHASPKHPQSDTGFAKARYKVNGVITLIRRSAKVDAIFRRTPKKRKTPTQNSADDRMMAKSNGRYVGNHEIMPNAARTL